MVFAVSPGILSQPRRAALSYGFVNQNTDFGREYPVITTT